MQYYSHELYNDDLISNKLKYNDSIAGWCHSCLSQCKYTQWQNSPITHPPECTPYLGVKQCTAVLLSSTQPHGGFVCFSQNCVAIRGQERRPPCRGLCGGLCSWPGMVNLPGALVDRLTRAFPSEALIWTVAADMKQKAQDFPHHICAPASSWLLWPWGHCSTLCP